MFEDVHVTMILTCLTKDYVVQASDRRLSIVSNGNVQAVTDHSNKAIVYNRHFVFAYTGTSQFGIDHTSDWVAQRLSEEKSLEDAVFHLRDRANGVMKYFYPTSSRAKEKMVGFVGAGFAEMKERGSWSLKPMRIMIANFVEERNGNWSWSKEFGLTHEELQPGQSHKLFVSGRPLKSKRHILLNKILRWCLRSKSARGPETIGRLLAREILKAAAEDEAIGTNIMCTFVPRDFIKEGSIMNIHIGGWFAKNPVMSAESQQLQPKNTYALHERFVFPPPFDQPRIIYIDNGNSPLLFHAPKYVRPGLVIPEITITVTDPPPIQEQDTSAEQ